ncbi:hypothetical protein FPV67DRAFT_1671883 [Lyophyllum atratum]|nr:hypothetical protein FPV67DRAFT_1671883 [Lyophyllum atratum]
MASTPTLVDLRNDLIKYPNALSPSMLSKASVFLTHAPQFKNDILIAQPANWPPESPPAVLPQSVALLLSTLCGVTFATVEALWDRLREMVWNHQELEQSVLDVLKKHGGNLGHDVLYPPVLTCTEDNCPKARQRQKLQKAEQWKAILYTLDRGAVPMWAVHLYCDKCKVNYHNNFKVKSRDRIYYDTIPDILQMSEHHFVETRVAEIWLVDMNIAWKSATNCARTYLSSMSRTNNLPDNWPYTASLDGEHVYDAFVILSLLRDHISRHSTLVVPHTGDQNKRFTDAMKERNDRIRVAGQPEINHWCTKCTRFYGDGEGKYSQSVTVVVMDGVTLGHPCCAIHNCKNPLITSRDRYCGLHQGQNAICAIIGCDAPVSPGRMTCHDVLHQRVEDVHAVRGQARFQLKERLKRARVAHPTDGVPQETDLSAIANDEDEAIFDLDSRDNHTILPQTGDDAQRPAAVGVRLKAQFGRKRTHNEQILVAPCGVILGRTTFFGAEAISSCVEFIKQICRINGHMPNHIFFDNNCQLKRHVQNTKDPAFVDVGLTVDVFHFTCKHSEKDTFCQTHCNPAGFNELKTEDGSWYFNSSIAEQTNVWIGGFHAIVREMLPTRFNFYLDQMILLRNEMTVVKLRKDGRTPTRRPKGAFIG